MIGALHKMYYWALKDFPRHPETVGLLAIMEYQCARVIAAKLPVRVLCLRYSHHCCIAFAGLPPDVS